jgi:hydroxymethylglutaryl-CoA synthase
VTKTNSYRQFVAEKIEKGERASSLVGNLYTSSIFLSLMSTLEADWQDGVELEGRHLGFFAYGSGSKSKVFQAELQEDWKAIVARFKLFETLDNRQKIDYRTYEYLHRGKIDTAVKPDSDRFSITHVRTERDDQEGARTYAWTGKVPVKHI